MLFRSSLTSANGLVIPQGVETLYLGSLTSANGLVIPQGVKCLYLRSLTSAGGLVIPQGVVIEGSRNSVSLAGDHKLTIGCQVHTIKSWLEHYRSIGKANGYTDAQIAEYKRYIDIFAAIDNERDDKE